MLGAAVEGARAADGRFEISQSHVPYTISRPGSYVVTEDLDSPSGDAPVIFIATNYVTLDLNGHRLQQAYDHAIIQSSGGCSYITVRHGRLLHVNNLARALELNSLFNRVEDVEICGFNETGLFSADYTLLKRCRVVGGEGFNGINSGQGSMVLACEAAGNTAYLHGTGISGDHGFLVVDSIVSGWRGTGIGSFIGFWGDTGYLCVNNVVSDNQLDALTVEAFRLGSGGLVAGCTAQGNQDALTNAAGILARDGVVVADCSIEGRNYPGITTSNGTIVARNALKGPNCDLKTGQGSVVRGNTLHEGGINVQEGCLVAGNSVWRDVYMNPLLLLAGAGYALENNLWGWDTPGIQMVGKNSRADRNNISTVTDIRVDLGSSNLIVRNRFNAMTIIASNDFVGATLVGSEGMSANLPWANIDW